MSRRPSRTIPGLFTPQIDSLPREPMLEERERISQTLRFKGSSSTGSFVKDMLGLLWTKADSSTEFTNNGKSGSESFSQSWSQMDVDSSGSTTGRWKAGSSTSFRQEETSRVCLTLSWTRRWSLPWLIKESFMRRWDAGLATIFITYTSLKNSRRDTRKICLRTLKLLMTHSSSWDRSSLSSWTQKKSKLLQR